MEKLIKPTHMRRKVQEPSGACSSGLGIFVPVHFNLAHLSAVSLSREAQLPVKTLAGSAEGLRGNVPRSVQKQ
eukprot:8692433-Alexandrium_andersonii.AAC.1